MGCVGGTMTARTVAGSSMEVWFQNRGKTIVILINPCQPNFFTCLLTMNSMSGFSVTKFSKLG